MFDKRLIVLSFLLLIWNNTYAQDSFEQPKNLAKAMIEKLMDLPNTPPGMSIAISQKGKIIFAEGFGYANLETKRRVTPNTQFRAASVSKVIAATSLAKLIQDKKIDLDEPAHSYVPMFPKKKYSFSTRQLAGHIAGIPHYSYKDKIEQRFYKSVEEALGVFAHIELLHEPGSEYQYSTHGYTLLSKVIEGASNQNFLDYLNNKVLKPLSMQATQPDFRSNPSIEMTELYDFYKEGINKGLPVKISNPEDPSYKWAGGGMVSTPTDLTKMGDSYINGFIKPSIVKTMFESQKLSSGKKTGVGIGWRENWDIDGRRIHEHAGSMGGTRSVISIFPDEKLTISIMANAQRIWAIEETAHMIALLFLTPSTPITQPKGKAEVILKVRNKGKEIGKKGILILDGENDRLIIEPNTGNMKIYPLIYLQIKNKYALIHPHGILNTTIDFNNNTISGKTMYYRSPGLVKPSQGLPLLRFSGSFTSEN